MVYPGGVVRCASQIYIAFAITYLISFHSLTVAYQQNCDSQKYLNKDHIRTGHYRLTSRHARYLDDERGTVCQKSRDTSNLD
jgi:hypothetical protein